MKAWFEWYPAWAWASSATVKQNCGNCRYFKRGTSDLGECVLDMEDAGTSVNCLCGSWEMIDAVERMSDSQKLISQECDAIREMLLEKNRKYGDSALNPVRIFSRADAVEQILVRIDDKLSRLMRGQGTEDEDVELDLAGYILLLRVARRQKNHADVERLCALGAGVRETGGSAP